MALVTLTFGILKQSINEIITHFIYLVFSLIFRKIQQFLIFILILKDNLNIKYAAVTLTFEISKL
jgi:hypothetical protein